jgi:predicted DNA-binding mobile mystery protein A
LIFVTRYERYTLSAPKPRRSASRLDRKQIDRRFEKLRPHAATFKPPRGGWIRALRAALGMRQRDLAAKLGVTAQAVAQMEAREEDGSVTVGALREAARAMGAELFYVVLPERSIASTLDERAGALARAIASQVHHSMRLEDQATGDEEREERVAEIKATLLQTPSLLWAARNDA